MIENFWKKVVKKGVEISTEDAMRNALKTDIMDIPCGVTYGICGDRRWVAFRVKELSTNKLYVTSVIDLGLASPIWVTHGDEIQLRSDVIQPEVDESGLKELENFVETGLFHQKGGDLEIVW
jgi:hypothetical protein